MDRAPAHLGAWIAASVAMAAIALPGDARARTAPPSDSRVRKLIDGLEARDGAANVRAANELARLGPAAGRAVPALRRLAAKASPRVLGKGAGWSPGEAAARALWAIRPAEVTRILEADNRQASLNAVAALEGRTSPAAANALRLAMIDPCDDVRLAAVRAMRYVAAAKGPPPSPAVMRRLGRATEDSNPQVRREAVAALAAVQGEKGQAALLKAVRFGSYRDTRVEAMNHLAMRKNEATRKGLRAVAADGDGRVADAARAHLRDETSTGGVITNETVASAENLRPLSTIVIHRPKRQSIRTWAEAAASPPPRPAAAGIAQLAGKLAPELAGMLGKQGGAGAGEMDLPPELLSALRAGAPLLGPNAKDAAKLNGMSAEALLKQMAQPAAGRKGRPKAGSMNQALMDLVRMSARQQAPGRFGKKNAGQGAADGAAGLQKLLGALGIAPRPAGRRAGATTKPRGK